MEVRRTEHLGQVYSFIKVLIACEQLVYWFMKIIAVTANYLGRRFDIDELYRAVPNQFWKVHLCPE
jgi:hypothetical protein